MTTPGRNSAWGPVVTGSNISALERVAPHGWRWRALAVPIDGDLAVISPVPRLGEAAFAGLAALGRPRYLVATNYVHYLGVDAHAQRFPEAEAVADPAAHARLKQESGRDYGTTAALVARLPYDVTLMRPEGTSSGELWLRFVADGRVAWAVADAFFNVVPNPKGLIGLAGRLTGTTPGLRIGRLWRARYLADRAAYKRWLLARIAADAPTILVPAHGDVIVDDALPERLATLAERRL